MRKLYSTFLGLFIFVMIIIPKNVFADTTSTGFNNLTRSTFYEYNINNPTDYYETTENTLSKITVQSNTVWYNFYTGTMGSSIVHDNKNYSPSFIKFYNVGSSIPLCSDECDLMLSFTYGFGTQMFKNNDNYSLSTLYLNRARQITTNFSGIKLVGIDVNDNPKEFYCTGQYVIGTLGQDKPYMKFFATCPTSNFKSITSILMETGFSAIDNTTNISINYYIDKLTWEISTYTGTQDGIGGSVSEGGDETVSDVYDAMTDDNIDSSFQNQTMSDINNQLATNSVISDLLLLPVRMYQSILNSLGNNTCQPFQLGSLYGTNLQLPCIQVQNYIGSTLWTTIDLIFCGIFVLVIRKKFVDIFNNMTNLKNGGNELE